MLTLSEPVNVWVMFKNARIEPLIFFWKNRKIKIDRVNLMHTSKNGNDFCYHFAVSGNGNFYQLRFDLRNLKWFLESVEEGE